MKVKIENLGPIKEAELSLDKPLTIFCGPNNSGKTYAAFLIYALTKSGFKYYKTKISQELINELIKEQHTVFKIDIDELWSYRLSEIKTIHKSLNSIYGISEELVTKLFSEFSIKIDETKKEFAENVNKMNFKNSLKLRGVNIEIVKNAQTNFIELFITKTTITKEDIEFLELFLVAKLFSLISFYPFTTSHILPVERNSIYTFSKELSIKKQEFLDRAQELGNNIRKNPLHWLLKRSTRYPLPIRDGLEISEDLSNFNSQKSDFYSFAEDIEKQLLNGKVSVTKDGEVQFTPNKAKRKKIPIHLTASIVKTLSSLVFYLKHIASENDLIIIDEPELNLHPNNQVILARIFAKLLNNGFRLLISTHSDYIIRELNNLIMLSSKKEGVADIVEKYNYSEDEKIKPEQVGAYLFNYKGRAKSVVVKPIEISEAGFEVSTIDATIDRLNEISEDLFYTLKYGTREQVK